jgi:hypothetical protein
MMNEHTNEVWRWVKSMPYQDNPNWSKASGVNVSTTWDEWVRRGREINGIEERLLWVLKHDNDPVTRSHVALALGFVGGDRSVSPLTKVLETDTSLVQMEAAASLGRLGKYEAVEPLCKALKNPDPNVRANACMALGQFVNEKAIDSLNEALEDVDPFVQNAAREALQIYQTGGKLKNENGDGASKRQNGEEIKRR